MTLFHPKNISSFDTYKQLHKDLNFSDTSHQVIASKDSVTFQPIPVNQACQTEQKEETQPCLATALTEEEDVPMYRRQLRNVFDSSFLAAATKKDRSLKPLLNTIKIVKIWTPSNQKSKLGHHQIMLRTLFLQRPTQALSARWYPLIRRSRRDPKTTPPNSGRLTAFNTPWARWDA